VHVFVLRETLILFLTGHHHLHLHRDKSNHLELLLDTSFYCSSAEASCTDKYYFKYDKKLSLNRMGILVRIKLAIMDLMRVNLSRSQDDQYEYFYMDLYRKCS
jgi:hypothetical protein